jgi:hypothetical protein
MSTRLLRWSLVALLVGLLVSTGSAQQPATPLFAVVTYYKVLPGQGEAYQAFVTTTSKKFYQELLTMDPTLVHWSVARVMYKGIEGQDFDYVSATVTSGPPAEPGRNLDAIYAKLGTTQAEYAKKLAVMRVAVGSEVLRSIAGASAAGSGALKEGDFRVSNLIRIKPGMGGEYADRAATLTQPTMREAAAQGDIKGWSVWTRMFPAGTATRYDVLGVTTFKDLASALGGPYPNRAAERFMKANPGKDYSAYFQNGSEYSESVQRSISQVVAMVERAAPAGRTSDSK